MGGQNEVSKRYIAEALIALMKKKSYDKITNKDITDKAGFSHITIYRHFKSKEEIIKYYLDLITNEFINTKKVNYNPDNFKEYLIVLFTHLKEKKDICDILYKANLIYLIKDEFDKIFYSKASSESETYNYCFISGGLYNVFYHWLIHGCKETPEQIADMFMHFYILKGDNT